MIRGLSSRRKKVTSVDTAQGRALGVPLRTSVQLACLAMLTRHHTVISRSLPKPFYALSHVKCQSKESVHRHESTRKFHVVLAGRSGISRNTSGRCYPAILGLSRCYPAILGLSIAPTKEESMGPVRLLQHFSYGQNVKCHTMDWSNTAETPLDDSGIPFF